MLFHSVRVLLMDFAISFKMCSAYCVMVVKIIGAYGKTSWSSRDISWKLFNKYNIFDHFTNAVPKVSYCFTIYACLQLGEQGCSNITSVYHALIQIAFYK